MLQIADDALALVREKQTTIFIDRVHSVDSCCFTFAPCPTVRFGRPKQQDAYVSHVIRGVEVFTPPCFPLEHPLTIRVSQFLGFRRLVIEGWRLV
ncbi:CC/Se motif family (seleno)protein [Telmatospirillum sp.]|uniref:CC/Se motif family (seleno)protein n=1 Tax=Telmatospirillum sp. TaxID=2079197 RepID=UPI00283D8E8C|nr:CC/Se motif family (seleno)protein [Telmatospirillum sp.]MDR3435101.1 CC/Se motif family (seleno)protein [Telmatospirillum sp.]